MQTRKVALITGSARGIGWGLAKRFARENHDIILHGICDNGDELARGLAAETGAKVVFAGHDLRDPARVRELVELAESELGRVDVLINNAGLQHVSPIEDFPLDKWNEIMAVNLNASFFAIQAAWKGMKERRYGRIINIASVHGLVASEFKAAYITAKHGILGLSKVVALEGAPFNITCNSICPGYVKTPLVDGQIRDQAKAHGISEAEVVEKVLLAKHVVKDFIPIDAIAEMALLLASEHGKLITGTPIVMDGGWTAQ